MGNIYTGVAAKLLHQLKTEHDAVIVDFDGFVLCWKGKHRFLNAKSIETAAKEGLKFLKRKPDAKKKKA